MKNQLIDLNNHLFAQMERLSDENLSDENLQREIERTKAVALVSKQIVDNASLALSAQKFRTEYAGKVDLPVMIGGKPHA
ncbi:hypothetical protein OTK51_04420 [Vibrio scophthalmi]|uniref:hypothetical protein n=1 Tax=Vibrio scophthalmi TaxID=45658 RepID=UPI002284DD18|nr:hypothetical protein [Vibrio scophthalmi]MCY9802672.1 hypothetical protein [Vibrio scophthalmi]